jgi:hypothetical protein
MGLASGINEFKECRRIGCMQERQLSLFDCVMLGVGSALGPEIFLLLGLAGSLAGTQAVISICIAFVLAPRLSSLNTDFTPRSFQAVLPKNYIHHAEPGGAIDRFFKNWHAAWQKVRSDDPRQTFIDSAYRLANHYGYEVDRRLMMLRRGFMVMRDEWRKS